MSITSTILQSYYPVVSTLSNYLDQRVQLADGLFTFRPRLGDLPCYVDLLERSHVAQGPVGLSTKQFNASAPMVPLHEVIERAQTRLICKSKHTRTPNVLAAGYRIAQHGEDVGRIGSSRVPIANYFLNTTVIALEAPEWRTLYHRIGEDVMFHLLTETSIFIALPNDCLCQVTGIPIIHLKPPPHIACVTKSPSKEPSIQRPVQCTTGVKRKISTAHIDERPTKRRKTASIEHSESTGSIAREPKRTPAKRTPADIVIPRSRIFYSWPYMIPHKSVAVIGLPPKHILNIIYPSYYSDRAATAGHWVDPDPREQAARVRHLAKYVFPRQFGLSHPFVETDHDHFRTHKPYDYRDREDEIKRVGSRKTPQRVKPSLTILDKLLWRHRKCKYKALLELVCPSKTKTNDQTPLDSSVILEMMSEHSIKLRSQRSLAEVNTSTDSAGHPVVPRGLSQAQQHQRSRPRFAEFACTFAEVYRYVLLVTDAVIPKAVWGCKRNRRLVNDNVKTFITARQYETTTLHNLLQGIRFTECDWLAPVSRASGARPRVTQTDAVKRRELLEEFLFWYFDSFLLSLLRTTFYVTESSACRRRILYFRQDDWSTLCAPLIERLRSETFQKIEQHEAEEILRQRKLGFSFVRLLPKETGVRPIVNLRRRKASHKDTLNHPPVSINQVLQAAFQILTYEKENQPKLLGASVFGSNEVYTKLKAFKTRLLESSTNGELPKLYFVKVDVQACFDTIEQSKLLEILVDAISEDGYLIQRYGQVNCNGSKARRKYVKKAQPEDDHPHFLDSATKLAAALRGTIFVDQVIYPLAQKQEVLQLLEEHITENIVKIGCNYYRQMVGIPQGSVLSALLCSFFYGDLERRHLRFTDHLQSLLLRLIDDYLFITTDLELARRFLSMMIRGHPEYGCFISKEKTLTNFYYNYDMNVTEPGQKGFPWCGYMINMSDLSVSTDYTRYHATYLQDSLTVDRGRRPGVAFVHKMMQLTKAKAHILFTDTTLNSRGTIYLTIYQNFLLSAMKMHHYVRLWGLSVKKNSAFLQNTIHQMIRYTYTAMRNKSLHKVARANDGRCDVQQAQVIWLGIHAFLTVLSHKPQTYPQLMKWLQTELSRPRNTRLRKGFQATVKEGLATLSLLAF